MYDKIVKDKRNGLYVCPSTKNGVSPEVSGIYPMIYQEVGDKEVERGKEIADLITCDMKNKKCAYEKDGGKKCPSYRPLDQTREGDQVQSYYCSGVTQGKNINPDSCPSGEYMWQINDDDKQCCSNFPQE